MSWRPQLLALRHGEAAFHTMWEDSALNAELLDPKPGERVLCIASAGENALSYAAKGARVKAIDINPAQAHLARLKAVVLARAGPAEYRRLFGDGRYPDFEALLDRVAPALPPEAVAHWRYHARAFDDNFHVHGAAGRALRWVRAFVERTGTLPAFEDLLRARSCDDQLEIWDGAIAPKLFGGEVKRVLTLAPFLRLFGMPAQQASALRSYDSVLAARFREVLETRLARENPYWQLAILHRYASCPHWLADDALSQARAGVEQLTICVEDLSVKVRTRPTRYHAIDLLDSPDWIKPADLAPYFRAIAGRLEPDGRVLLRSVGWHTVEAAKTAGLALDVEATTRASREELTGLYRVTALLRAG